MNQNNDVAFPLSKISFTWTFQYAIPIITSYTIGYKIFDVSYWVWV